MNIMQKRISAGIVTFIAAAALGVKVLTVSEPARMIVPLYVYPSSTGAWQQVIAANQYGNIDIIANPSDGHFTSIDSSYQIAIRQMKEAGVGVYGYTYSLYGSRPMATLKADVDNWIKFYQPQGIFIDEASNSVSQIPYYKEIYDYIHAKGLTVIINPGTSTVQGYMDVADNVTIFESSVTKALTMPVWGWLYPASKFSVMAWGADVTRMRSFVEEAKSKHFGYIYVIETGEGAAHHWNTNPPSYLAEMAALLAGGAVVPTVTASQVVPTFTNTLISPTKTSTTVPTRTPVPATSTPIPATATRTAVPASATSTAVPPSATSTPSAVPTFECLYFVGHDQSVCLP